MRYLTTDSEGRYVVKRFGELNLNAGDVPGPCVVPTLKTGPVKLGVVKGAM